MEPGRRTIKHFWLAALLIAMVPAMQPVGAIKCYVCQSNVDPKCADPFDNLTLPITDCEAYPRADLVARNELEVVEEKGFFAAFSQPAPVKPLRATMCRKIRQKVDGEWRTIRGCGYLGLAGQGEPNCQMRHGTYDVFMETCTCNDKDGCNAATRGPEPAQLTILTITAMAMQLPALISRI